MMGMYGFLQSSRRKVIWSENMLRIATNGGNNNAHQASYLRQARAAGTAAGLASPAIAGQETPTIGFGMALTGSLAPNGKSALLGMQIWEEDVNKRGGILGRPVKLVYYDDQSNPSGVPAIYTKLLDVDKVDIVTSGYATNMIAPAMPVIMQHDRTFFSLLGLAVNSEFHYPRYFSVTPTGGPNPKEAFSEAFFAVPMAQTPKPDTPALTGADPEFPRNALDGGVAGQEIRAEDRLRQDLSAGDRRLHAGSCARSPRPTGYLFLGVLSRRLGRHHPGEPRGRLQASSCSAAAWSACRRRPQDPARTAAERHRDLRFLAALAGLATDDGRELVKKYQSRSAAAGVDLLGYYMPPFGYALCQIVEQAVTATGGTNDDKLADYARKSTFKTVAGDIKFNAEGEWAESQVMAVQFQGVTGNDVDQFRDPKTEVILAPAKYATGKLIYPYDPSK